MGTMDIDLPVIVAVLTALSVVTERFVEIIKGLIKPLSEQCDNAWLEGFRKAGLQILAIVGAILITYFTRDFIVDNNILEKKWVEWPNVLYLGLLASGGSGFWNSFNTYVTKLKDLKKEQAKINADEAKKKQAEAKLAQQKLAASTG